MRGFVPDFDGLFTRTSYARAYRLASPRHAMPRPGPVRRASARIYFSLSPLLHTFTSA
jgi:hypothetical protein